MSEQNNLTLPETAFPIPMTKEEEISLREFLRTANAEIEASLKQVQSSREESDRLAVQIEAVMGKLRAA